MSESKRGPGRPRTKPLPNPTLKIGIIDKPINDSNFIEFKYDSPDDFKKINNYFSNIGSEIILFKFDKNETCLYGTNHLVSNQVRVIIDGDKCVNYYCEEPFEIKIKRSNLEKVLSIIDKQYLSISFILQKDDHNKNLYIIMNTSHLFEETYKISLIDDYDEKIDISDNDFIEEEPPKLSFNLSGAFFKKITTVTKKYDKKLTFQKLGKNGVFELKYSTSQSQVEASISPEKSNAKELNLMQNIEDLELFSVSAQHDSLKPTANTNLSKMLHFQLWSDKKIFTTANLNKGAIVFQIRINIIDFNNIYD